MTETNKESESVGFTLDMPNDDNTFHITFQPQGDERWIVPDDLLTGPHLANKSASLS